MNNKNKVNNKMMMMMTVFQAKKHRDQIKATRSRSKMSNDIYY